MLRQVDALARLPIKTQIYIIFVNIPLPPSVKKPKICAKRVCVRHIGRCVALFGSNEAE